MGRRKKRIFISHSVEDDDFVTRNIRKTIASAKQKDWFAPDSILPGDEWEKRIRTALAHCDRLLVVISKDSASSDNVKREVRFFMRRMNYMGSTRQKKLQKVVLPVRIGYRDPLGKKVKESDPDAKVNHGGDIHPELEDLNNIEIPYSDVLEKRLDKGLNEQHEDWNKLSVSDQNSIEQYIKARDESLDRLRKGIRARLPSEQFDGSRIRTLFDAALGVMLVALIVFVLWLPGGLLNPLPPAKDPMQPTFEPNIEFHFGEEVDELILDEPAASVTRQRGIHFTSVNTEDGQNQDSIIRSPSDEEAWLPTGPTVEVKIVSEAQLKALKERLKAQRDDHRDLRAYFRDKGVTIRPLLIRADFGGVQRVAKQFVAILPRITPPKLTIAANDIALAPGDDFTMKDAPVEIQVSATGPDDKSVSQTFQILPRSVTANLSITDSAGRAVDDSITVAKSMKLQIKTQLQESKKGITTRTLSLSPPPISQQKRPKIDLLIGIQSDDQIGTRNLNRVKLCDDLDECEVAEVSERNIVAVLKQSPVGENGAELVKYAKLRMKRNDPPDAPIPLDAYIQAIEEVYNRGEVTEVLRHSFPDQFRVWNERGYLPYAQDQYLRMRQQLIRYEALSHDDDSSKAGDSR